MAALKAEWKQLDRRDPSKDVYAYFKKTARMTPRTPRPHRVHRSLHRPRAARAALGPGGMEATARSPCGPERSGPSAYAANFPSTSAFPKRTCASSCPIPARATAANIPAKPPRSRAPLQGRRQTGQAQLDPRRGDDLGVFPSRRLIEVGGRLNPDGTIAEWEIHNYNSGPSGLQTPYDVAKKSEQHHPRKTPLRQGSYRGLAATANHFARESLHGRTGARSQDGPTGIPPEERPATSGCAP